MKVLLLVLAAVALGLAVVGAAAAAQPGPLHLTFDKQNADGDGVWEGTVSGDAEGRLKTVLISIGGEHPCVKDVVFDWIIKAEDDSFKARLAGTLDACTGAVQMSGSVSTGRYLGAFVQEAGQLQDLATLRFTGTIDVYP
jgi:hypothetical protein